MEPNGEQECKKTIGLILAVKKAENMGFFVDPVLDSKLAKHGIGYKLVDETRPLEEQGPFHMIVHKLTDYCREAERGHQPSVAMLQQIIEYERCHPECLFVDSTELVFTLACREKMSQLCDRAVNYKKNAVTGEFEYCPLKINNNHNGSQRVFVPKWVAWKNREDVHNDELNKHLRYPILCKALNAAEGPGAHDMQLIFTKEQLSELKVFPCIAQNFVNHDMNMCKIFIVGDKWCIVTRPSIRNVKVDNYVQKNGFSVKRSIVFDSHSVSKPGSFSVLNKYGRKYKRVYSEGRNEILKDQVVLELIDRLRDLMPFTLLGIDLIVNNDGYGLIDVNFLPGYDGMRDFGRIFADFVLSKLS